MDVADLFQLQRPLQGNGKVNPPAQVNEVLGFAEVVGQLLDISVPDFPASCSIWAGSCLSPSMIASIRSGGEGTPAIGQI